MKVTSCQNCLGPNIYSEAPDGGWGWVVALAFFWVEVCTYGTLKTLVIYLEVLMDESRESGSRVSWVVSTCLFVFSFTAPLSTVLSNRFGHRPVVMAGGFLISLGTISSAFTSSINEMYVTIGVISGLGYCFTFLPTVTVLAQYFSRRRVLVISLASTGESLTIFMLVTALFKLKNHFDWRYCLVVLGTIQASVIGCGLLLRPIIIVPEPVKEDDGPQKDSLALKQMQTVYDLEKEQTRTSINSSVPRGSEDSGVSDLSASNMDVRTAVAEAKSLKKEQDAEGQGSPSRPEQDQGDLVEVDAGPQQPSSPKLLDFSVLKDGAFICYSLFGLFATLGFFAPQYIIIDLKNPEGMGALIPYFSLIIAAVAELVGRLSIGVVLNQACCRKTLMLGCVILLCLVLVASTIVEELGRMLVFFFLGGFLMGAVASTHIPLLAEEEVVGIEKMSSSVGIYVFIQSFAGLAGPPLGGVLVDVVRYYGAADATPAILYSSAVAMGLSAICLALVGPAKSGLCQRQGRRIERGPARQTEDQNQTSVIQEGNC